MAEAESRHLRGETLRRYRLIASQVLAEFGNQLLFEIYVDRLSRFQEKWALALGTARTKIGILRALFAFCVERGWIERNPAVLLTHPKMVQRPTLVSDEDFHTLLGACGPFPAGGSARERVQAFNFGAAPYGSSNSGLHPAHVRQNSGRQIIPPCAETGMAV
jgi:site-specific recombinase XerD